MKAPLWITLAEAIALHQMQLVAFGGPSGIRDEGLLESALARPLNVFAYDRIGASFARLAAAYAYGIVMNHPFVDGNKRAGFFISAVFLDRNGVELTAGEDEVYYVFTELAAGHIKEHELFAWFERMIAKQK